MRNNFSLVKQRTGQAFRELTIPCIYVVLDGSIGFAGNAPAAGRRESIRVRQICGVEAIAAG